MSLRMNVRVRLVSWQGFAEQLAAIRTTVFVLEQGVPAEIEHDGRDPECVHALAEDDQGRALGTGRLLPDGQIGRMAVLAVARGAGVGTALLHALLDAAAERQLPRVQLHAQAHAQRFYARHGFEVSGEEFIEAGIAHVMMQRRP